VEQVWYTDYIKYSVSHILDFNINEPNVTNVQVNTQVDTSQFPIGTAFFWAETTYRQVQNEDKSYHWEEDYRHNFDGSDTRQTLSPRIPNNPEQPALPQTGTRIHSKLWLQLGVIGLGIGLAKSRKKNNG
jgi:hypothetical protein